MKIQEVTEEKKKEMAKQILKREKNEIGAMSARLYIQK
jgi:hypothetical protein